MRVSSWVCRWRRSGDRGRSSPAGSGRRSGRVRRQGAAARIGRGEPVAEVGPAAPEQGAKPMSHECPEPVLACVPGGAQPRAKPRVMPIDQIRPLRPLRRPFAREDLSQPQRGFLANLSGQDEWINGRVFLDPGGVRDDIGLPGQLAAPQDLLVIQSAHVPLADSRRAGQGRRWRPRHGADGAASGADSPPMRSPQAGPGAMNHLNFNHNSIAAFGRIGGPPQGSAGFLAVAMVVSRAPRSRPCSCGRA